MEDKFKTWEKVVNLREKAFKKQGSDNTILFQGTLETDGIGASIVKQNTSTSRKGQMISSEKYDQDTVHIESLSQKYIEKTIGRCVLIDPGRRDILYCMKETSVAKNRDVLIYAKMNRKKRSRRFRYLRKANQPEAIKEATETLSKTGNRSVNLDKFSKYVMTRASVKVVMYNHYGNETINSDQVYFPDTLFDFRVDKDCNLYDGSLFIAKLRSHFPQHKDNSANLQQFNTYLRNMLQHNQILQRLNSSERTEIMRLADETLERNPVGDYKRKISHLLQKTQLLPFRKMKFSSKLYYDQNDSNLVRNLRNKFGKDAILVIGQNLPI